MTLAAGSRLGPYEIVAPLGAGGMGEVWRARDTRLGRDVAVKVLPREMASDSTALSRFEREAKAVSALSHPHICALFDVGSEEGQAYLVMELLAGTTLHDRLLRGRLPLAEALETAAEIGEALDAAHKRGIIHRDLKPSNVMLTKTGVKLLDFGVARLIKGRGQAGVELTSMATEEAPLTGQGAVVGTIPYMAPEQLEGKPADARTDIWALGATLYEMVTGKRAFEGTSSANLIAAILEHEPKPLAAFQPVSPPALDRLVKRCLAKSPDDRWDSAHDVADELRWIAQTLHDPETTRVDPARRRTALLSLTSGIAIGLAGFLAFSPARPHPQVVRSVLDIAPAEEVNGGSTAAGMAIAGSLTAMAWTPDGHVLVFIGRRDGTRRLYVRSLGDTEARVLDGTEGVRALTVSSDGKRVAFWTGSAIRSASLAGGPTAVMVDGIPELLGMTWTQDGRVLCALGDVGRCKGIVAVSAEHHPTDVTKMLENETAHVLPHSLPNGHAFLYTVRHRINTFGDEDVVAQILATGERKVLLKDAADARYVPPGFLVFLRRGRLFGISFDATRLEVHGTAVPVLDHVAQGLTGAISSDCVGAGQFSIAPNGTLAYVRGEVVPYPDTDVVTVDRSGWIQTLGVPRRSYRFLALSPDGLRLALATHDLTSQALWIFHPSSGKLRKMSSGGEYWWPRWTPRGQSLSWSGLEGGVFGIALQQEDGAGPPDVIFKENAEPSSWSPDGRYLAFMKDYDIWTGTLEGRSLRVAPFMQTPEREAWPEFSPDGEWLAYGSNHSGRFEIYVAPFAGTGPRHLVSVDGGISPAWSPTGRELFFLSELDSNGKRQMMTVEVRLGKTFSSGKPVPLFTYSGRELVLGCIPVRCWAVSPDGARFYALRKDPPPPHTPVTQIQLVQNFVEEVKARVAEGEKK